MIDRKMVITVTVRVVGDGVGYYCQRCAHRCRCYCGIRNCLNAFELHSLSTVDQR